MMCGKKSLYSNIKGIYSMKHMNHMSNLLWWWNKMCQNYLPVLSLKAIITTAADSILIFFFFSEKVMLDISCGIVCLADDSHEIPSLIFSEKNSCNSALTLIIL